jgi:hypothetical protein
VTSGQLAAHYQARVLAEFLHLGAYSFPPGSAAPSDRKSARLLRFLALKTNGPYRPSRQQTFSGLHGVFASGSRCSRVMMIGKWPGDRKFASSTRVAAYSGVAAPCRISAVESNQVMASPS